MSESNSQGEAEFADELDEIQVLLHVCARKLCKSNNPVDFLKWIAECGPDLAPNFAAKIDPRTGPIGHAFRAFGVAIYNAMPLPDADFRPRPLPKPGRNDPCSCGSGAKFKQCCQPLGETMSFGHINLLRFVLEVIPKKRFAELTDSKVDVHAVAHTSMEWNDEQAPKEVVALLEPWFAPGRKLHARLEPLFDQLMESYLQLGRARKREALLKLLMDSGDRTLRAAALQRRATMLSDRGQHAEAWEVFRDAQREDPDSPSIGLLEVTLLVSGGQTQQARERARFWAARLERARDPDLQPMIQFMREIVADPSATFAAMSGDRNPDIGRLMQQFAVAPAPAAHYAVDIHDGLATLVAGRDMATVEAGWRAVYPQEKPVLSYTQLDSPQMWDDAAPWLDFLDATPLAWHSLDVLDDLAMAVEVLAELGLDQALLEPLLERGYAVLEVNLPADGPGVTLPWMIAGNRPALRMLAHQTFRALAAAHDDDAQRRRFIALARQLLTLNPNDNHGVRAALSRVYLELGEADNALQLCAAFPDDMICETALNRILALYDLGRRGDALTALSELPKVRGAAVNLLLAANPKAPRATNAYTTLVGGKEEAWTYRAMHYELWRRNGALDWLRTAWRALRK